MSGKQQALVAIAMAGLVAVAITRRGRDITAYAAALC